jgi:hypothetical protein
MVPGDLRLGRTVQRGDSGGRIAVRSLGGMMSLDPLSYGFDLVVENAVYAMLELGLCICLDVGVKW